MVPPRPPEPGSLFPSITGPGRALGLGLGREVLDAYWTPLGAARACLAALDDAWGPAGFLPTPWGERAARSVLEPAVGGGAWVLAAQDAWGSDVDRIDLDPDAPGLQLRRAPGQHALVADFLDPIWLIGGVLRNRWDVLLGNPPYGGDLTRWFDRSLELAPVVGYLLRSTILGSAERAPWWEAHPPACVWTLAPRPRWGGPGARPESDTVDSVFVVWVAGVTDTRYRLLRWTA